MGAADGRYGGGSGRHRPSPGRRLPGAGAQHAGLRGGAGGGGRGGRGVRRRVRAVYAKEHQLLDRREPRALRTGRRGGPDGRDRAARLRVLRARLSLRRRGRAHGGRRGRGAPVPDGLRRGVAGRHHRRRHAGAGPGDGASRWRAGADRAPRGALPRHLRPGAGQRARLPGARRGHGRRLGGGARRVPLRAGRLGEVSLALAGRRETA
jgi:hypothetical protein